MSPKNAEVTLELLPSARLDVIDVSKRIQEQFGDVLARTKKKLEEATNTIDQAEVRRRNVERSAAERTMTASAIELIDTRTPTYSMVAARQCAIHSFGVRLPTD